MSLKVKLYRGFLIVKNWTERFNFIKNEKIGATQELGIKIFEKCLQLPDAELLIAPISGTHYIESKDIFIVLDGNDLRIVNGRYEYHIFISTNSYHKLSDKFKRVLEAKRKKMEESMVSKTNKSLSEILEEVSMKTQ